MAAIKLDLSHWPVAVTTPPQSTVSDEELSDYLSRYYDLTEERGGNYVTVIELTGHPGITATQRSHITEYMRSIEQRDSATCVGTGLVFDSKMLRGLLTAIFWVKRPEYEIKVFGDVQTAIEWGRRKVSGEARDTG